MNAVSVIGLERYLIDVFGNVYDSENFNQIIEPVMFNPYACFVLYDADGIKRLRTRHRLIAMAFIPCPGEYSSMVVNHINGIPSDDRIENLEWVTYRENSEHAGLMGLTSKCIPLLVRDSDSGTVEQWPSLISYAINTGLTKDAIAYRVSVGPGRIFPERKQYRALNDIRDWYLSLNVDNALAANGNSQAIYVRNCLTGEIAYWENMGFFAEHIGVSLPCVSKWLSKIGQPVIAPQMIQIKRAQDPTPWRIVPDAWLEVDQSTLYRVVVFEDLVNNLVRFYIGLSELMVQLNLKKTTLAYRLQQPNKVWENRYRISYYSNYLVRLSCERQL